MGFWNGERCEYCEGEIVDRKVDVPRKAGREYVLIRNVSAGVCKGCGSRFFAANELKRIEMALKGKIKPVKRMTMKVYAL